MVKVMVVEKYPFFFNGESNEELMNWSCSTTVQTDSLQVRVIKIYSFIMYCLSNAEQKDKIDSIYFSTGIAKIFNFSWENRKIEVLSQRVAPKLDGLKCLFLFFSTFWVLLFCQEPEQKEKQKIFLFFVGQGVHQNNHNIKQGTHHQLCVWHIDYRGDIIYFTSRFHNI